MGPPSRSAETRPLPPAIGASLETVKSMIEDARAGHLLALEHWLRADIPPGSTLVMVSGLMVLCEPQDGSAVPTEVANTAWKALARAVTAAPGDDAATTRALSFMFRRCDTVGRNTTEMLMQPPTLRVAMFYCSHLRTVVRTHPVVTWSLFGTDLARLHRQLFLVSQPSNSAPCGDLLVKLVPRLEGTLAHMVFGDLKGHETAAKARRRSELMVQCVRLPMDCDANPSSAAAAALSLLVCVAWDSHVLPLNNDAFLLDCFAALLIMLCDAGCTNAVPPEGPISTAFQQHVGNLPAWCWTAGLSYCVAKAQLGQEAMMFHRWWTGACRVLLRLVPSPKAFSKCVELLCAALTIPNKMALERVTSVWIGLYHALGVGDRAALCAVLLEFLRRNTTELSAAPASPAGSPTSSQQRQHMATQGALMRHVADAVFVVLTGMRAVDTEFDTPVVQTFAADGLWDPLVAVTALQDGYDHAVYELWCFVRAFPELSCSTLTADNKRVVMNALDGRPWLLPLVGEDLVELLQLVPVSSAPTPPGQTMPLLAAMSLVFSGDVTCPFDLFASASSAYTVLSLRDVGHRVGCELLRRIPTPSPHTENSRMCAVLAMSLLDFEDPHLRANGAAAVIRFAETCEDADVILEVLNEAWNAREFVLHVLTNAGQIGRALQCMPAFPMKDDTFDGQTLRASFESYAHATGSVPRRRSKAASSPPNGQKRQRPVGEAEGGPMLKQIDTAADSLRVVIASLKPSSGADTVPSSDSPGISQRLQALSGLMGEAQRLIASASPREYTTIDD